MTKTEKHYMHKDAGSVDTRKGWIASYPAEELEERDLTAEQAFDEDEGATLIEVVRDGDEWVEPTTAAARIMGRKGGSAKSEKKAKSSAANGKKGGRPKAMMTKEEKKAKLDAMRAQMAWYDRTGDIVMRDQMARSIEEAKASWTAK